MNTDEQNQDDCTKLAKAITVGATQIQRQMITRRSKHGKSVKQAYRVKNVKKLLDSEFVFMKKPDIRIVAMPKDANPDGDIFGGWILSMMDTAGAIPAVSLPKPVLSRWQWIMSSSTCQYLSATALNATRKLKKSVTVASQ